MRRKLAAFLAALAAVTAIGQLIALASYTPQSVYKCVTWTATTTWTAPPDVPWIKLRGYGGGGGGGAGGRGWNVGTSSPGGGGPGGSGGGAAFESTTALQITPGNTYLITIGAGGSGGIAESPTLVTTTTSSFTEPTNDGAHSTTVSIGQPAGVYGLWTSLPSNTGAGILIADAGYYVVNSTSSTSTSLTILSSGLSGQVDAGTVVSSGAAIYYTATFPTNGGDTTFSTTLADGGAGTLLWSWFGGQRGASGPDALGASAGSGQTGGCIGSRFVTTQTAGNFYPWACANQSVQYWGGGTGGGQGGASHSTGSTFSGAGLSTPFAGAAPDGGNNVGSPGTSTSDAGGGGGIGGGGGWNWLDSTLNASTCVGGSGGTGGDSTDSLTPGNGANADGGTPTANTGNGGCGGGGGGGSTLAGAAAGVGGNGTNGSSGKLVGCYVSQY